MHIYEPAFAAQLAAIEEAVPGTTVRAEGIGGASE